MNLVTVIIPVYNVEAYLKKCIDSVLGQSYKDIEVILVDDGSSDGSYSICKEFSEKDKRVRCYHTKNLGLSNARNVGLDHANGEYIVFVDSDDFVHRNMIETLLFKADNADLVICNYERVSDAQKVTQDIKCLKDEYWDIKRFWHNYYWSGLRVFCCVAWNKLYKKKLFDNVRYPVGKIHEDEYIIGDIVSQCNKIKVISDSLYFYVQRENSIMHKDYRGNLEEAEAYLSRCKAFQKRDLIEVSRENLSEIPQLLITGLIENNNSKFGKKMYRFLRSRYNFFSKQYLKKDFSIKMYLKGLLLWMPHLYASYVKLKTLNDR